MKLSRCKINKKHQVKLLKFLVLEVTARAAADFLEIHPNSAALFYRKVRQIIHAQLQAQAHEVFNGEIELDESYFGGTQKGKRGQGACGKTIVFGLLKRNGRVYTIVVPDAKAETLMPVVRQKVHPDSVVYTDHWRSYNALDVAGFVHHRINHSTQFAQGRNHINGIENFWNQAKRVMRKYNGIPKGSFELFLKECEFRFNYGSPKQQLKVLRAWTQI